MISMPMLVKDFGLWDDLDELAERNQNLRPLLDRWQVWMTRSLALNFIHEGRPKKWAVLAKTTIFGRRKQSSRILQDTGRLRMSVMTRGAKGNVTRITANSLIMGTSLKQAAWLQYGTAPYTIRPRKGKALRFKVGRNAYAYATIVHHPGLVARPFIGIQKEDEVEMQRLATEFALGN